MKWTIRNIQFKRIVRKGKKEQKTFGTNGKQIRL